MQTPPGRPVERKEAALQREFAREYHLITREDRLEKIAEDLVAHFMGRGRLDKAMVVCVDKATAVRMYDKVQAYWRRYVATLKAEAAAAPTPLEQAALSARVRFMEETDMAVVVSQGQNEIADMAKKGLDIVPHRRRMVAEDMESKFKDLSDPFRLVFVCAMWMTGFDVPSCSTIYLDKPMRNHTLMQTIARANRVFRDKINGTIVDYIGVFRDLQRALAIYGSAADGSDAEGESPVRAKADLLADLRQAIADSRALLATVGIDVDALLTADGFSYIGLRDDAVDALVADAEFKGKFLVLANVVSLYFKAILPDPAATEFSAETALFRNLAEKIRSLTPPADISTLMDSVTTLLDESVAAESYVIRAATADAGSDQTIDLSQIDFDALKARFAAGRKHLETERLKGAINSRLARMVRLNRTRMDLAEKFQEMIEEYNAGSRNVEEMFQQLLAFAAELDEEAKRTLAEQLTEEELALFDLLTRPDPGLSDAEAQKVKKVTRELLETLKNEKLVLDWRSRQQSRAAVRLAIGTSLDLLPDLYTTVDYRAKCDIVYQHVYDSYYGSGQSIYASAI